MSVLTIGRPEVDERSEFVAGVICGMGGDVIAELHPLGADELEAAIRLLSDRQLAAAGMYATVSSDVFFVTLLAREEGRRQGIAEARRGRLSRLLGRTL